MRTCSVPVHLQVVVLSWEHAATTASVLLYMLALWDGCRLLVCACYLTCYHTLWCCANNPSPRWLGCSSSGHSP